MDNTGSDDESNSRPQKRKKTIKDLSKGPTMSVNAPVNIHSATNVTGMPSGPMETTIETGLVIEIQEDEEQQAKQLTSQTLQQLSNLASSGSTEKAALQSVHKKIKEYQTALVQRDDLIGQLQSRLAETIQQRDELIANSQEQETSFRQEIATLQLQLQQAIDMVTNQKTGVNPRDHLELKNKLVVLQQERSQQEITVKQLSGELESRIEVYGQLDYKYKQILQKFKKLTNDAQIYQAEKTNLEGLVEQLKEDHKMQLATWESEKEVTNTRITNLEEERGFLSTENTKMRDEIQNLMQRLQQMAEEVKEKEKTDEATRANAEEQFGIQLTLIKKQMSDIHAEDMARVSKEIDDLQNTHQENISSLNSINMNLKSQLEAQAGKVQHLELENKEMKTQLEELKSSKNYQNEELRNKETECNEVNNKFSECQLKFNELQVTYQSLLLKEESWIVEKAKMTEELDKSKLLIEEVCKLEEEVKLSIQIEKECAVLKEEKNRLNRKCSELSSLIENLTIEKRELESEGMKRKDENEKLNIRLQEESKVKATLEKECEHLKQEQVSMSTQNTQLCSRIKDLEEESKGMSAQNTQLCSRIKDLEKESKGMSDQNTQLCSRVKDLEEESKGMSAQNTQLCSHIKDLEEESKTHSNRATELIVQVEGMSSEKRKLEEELKAEKDEVNRVTNKLQEENHMRLDFENKYNLMKAENEKRGNEVAHLSSCVKELEIETGKSGELRNCITALETQYREAKEVKEEYEKKCSSLNDRLLSLDQKLAEAHKLHLESSKNSIDGSVVDELKVKLSTAEEEVKQLKEKCEKIEKDKIDVETERDELVERYKMVNAELGSAMLALDRELQLTTHRRLSDIGSSLSKGFGDLATQTDQQPPGDSLSSGGNSEKDVLLEEADVFVPRLHASVNQDFDQRMSDLEKENKDLHNEAEKLKMKLKDQNFMIKSYESRHASVTKRLASLEADKQKLKAELEEHQNTMLEKLDCQRQLTELRLSKNIQEQNWHQLEKHVPLLLETVKDNRELNENADLSSTIRSIELSFSESQMRESFSNPVSRGLDDTAELETFRHSLETALAKVLSDLDELDKVSFEKHEVELENLALRDQIMRLESKQQQLVAENRGLGNDAVQSKENVFLAEEQASLTALKKEVQKYKLELGRLQRVIDRQAVHLNLQKQALQSSKLRVQVGNVTQAQFDTCNEAVSTDKYVEVTMKNLRQAILKNVSSQYMEALTKTLTKLEDVILTTLHNPSIEILCDSTPNASSIGQFDELQLGVSLDQNVKMFTENVEQLINIRTTLVDASNELVEQLEEAVTQRLSSLKLEIEDLVKLASQGDVSDPVPKSDDTSVRTKLNIECYQEFIQEFVEVTNNIAEEAQGEKLQILESQQALIQKILEENKLKISSLGQERLHHLENVKTLPEAFECTKELMSSLEATLTEEITWVNQQYRELLNQYSYEQEFRKKSHTNKLKELESTLTSLLENSPLKVELTKLASSHKAELEKLKEDHRAEVKHLQNQIDLQDNEMLRHLQSLYSDREWYRKTVGLLSHVALQLLHYFTVAESYIKKPQTPQLEDLEIQEEQTLLQPESLSGMAKDLSFLSDCKTDFIGDNVLSTFPEDNAMSTALIGKSVHVDHSEDLEVASASGSMLDSTILSEGLLEDMDKDEQVRSMLTKFYPQLMSILKGRWERVVVECLEKEVQELTIALQASAGMLKIFMHSVITENKGPSSNIPHESSYVRGGTSYHSKDTFIETLNNKTSDSNQMYSFISLQQSDHPGASGQRQNDQNKSYFSCQEGYSSKPAVSSQFGDLTHLTQDLASILSQEETVLDFTVLTTPKLDTKEKISMFLKELCSMAEKIESLQLHIHRQEGMIQGFEEERKSLQDEISRLEHYNKNLAQELQVTKDQLSDYERETENKTASSPSYAEKMEASKDTKERVRAVLSAKTKSSMDHGELVTRNADLERLLESLVRDYDREVEELKCRAADLSQQLEVADRQLRSNRQFLDEQAIEREREREEMQKENENLAVQLRDKNNLQLQHGNLSNKVECLERELQDKAHEFEGALANLKKHQVELKASEDKISDQHDTISSLEAQLDARSKTENELYIQNENLIASCNELKKENEELRSKLEEHLCAGDPYKSHNQEETVNQKLPSYNPLEIEDSMVHRDGEPLSQELLDSSDVLLEQNRKMIYDKYLDRISEYLAMLFSEGSASQSEEDLSDRNHLGMPLPVLGESDRTLSPSGFNQQSLEEKLTNLERTAEAAVKRVQDMQMTEKHARASYEEVNEERLLMQKHIDKQHNEIASLQVRLEELRRIDNCQCASLQEKVTYLKEELDISKIELIKINQKNKNLKHELSELQELLKCRESEIRRLQSNKTRKPKDLKNMQENETDNTGKIVGMETEDGSESLEVLRDAPESPCAFAPQVLTSKAQTYRLSGSSELLTSPAPSSQQDPSLSTINSSSSKDNTNTKADTTSRNRNNSSSDSDDKEAITLTKEDYQSLCSAMEEVGLVKVENELLQKEIRSLNDYQAKLEEDFRSSQQLLEAREEEILQLTEEMVDGGPQPLASETLQLQQTCEHLEQQLLTVQVEYDELYGTNIKCKNELDKLTLRYEELQLETEKLKSTNEMLMADIDIKAKALTKMEEKHHDVTKGFSDKNSKLQDELLNTQKQLENEKHELQSKLLQIKQLNLQLKSFREELAEKSTLFSKDKELLEHHHQEEIAGMRRQQKQLEVEYEERLSAQIKCLAEKFVKEKEAVIAQQVRQYEVALQIAIKEREKKEQCIQELEQRLQENTLSAHLSDSLKDLGEGIREEVSKSSRLDSSLVSYYMEGGLDGCDSVQPSTRASSVGDETEEIKSRLQIILSKIRQEGKQVLTSRDRRFLLKYGSYLDSTDRNIIASLDLSEPSSRESSVSKLDIKERNQYVRRIAELESEISQKDNDLKRLTSQSNFRLEQEKLVSNNWKITYEDEKQRKQELTEKLHQERLTGYEQISELAFLRSRLSILEPKLQKLHEENLKISESIEEKSKNIDTLNVALQTERSNFSVVSKALNDQRSIAEITKTRHAKLVKDLQNSLEEERGKNEKLIKELHANKFNRKSRLSSSEESVKPGTKSGLKSTNSHSSLEELQTRLAIEQERVVELQRKYDVERGKVANLNEQTSVERARAHTELVEEQARCAELTAVVKNNQLEKENLLRMMNQDKDRLRQRELHVRDLENKLSKIESELQAQTTACQVTSHKVREEDAQLHLKYSQAIHKLGEAEAEICLLKQNVKSLKNEIEECREKEKSVLEELKRERAAIDRLGLPALARSNNLSEYFELQVKENLQLCKLVLKNFDDKEMYRKTIASLESKVQELTQKYANANSEKVEISSNETYLRREIKHYTEQIALLQNTLSQKDAELQSRANVDNNNYLCLNDRMQHVYDENLRLKSRLKSLLFQKQYLLSCLRTYKDNEVQLISRMENITERFNPVIRLRPEATSENKQIRYKLKVYVLEVIAINRMKFLAQRWKSSRRIGSQVMYSHTHNAQIGRSYRENNNQLTSSNTVSGMLATGARSPETASRAFAVGLTPPTRDPSNLPRRNSSQSGSCRSLFVDRESREYDKFIERLDSIHSQFGINVKK